MQSPSKEKLNQIEEYQRRLAQGLNPEPLVPLIDLKEIAGDENYDRVTHIESLKTTSTTHLRGQEISYQTTSKRLLWQAFGQEHIEPDLLNFIDEIPADSVYFDIGASNGIFALYAAATGKKVFCFEPEAANFALLSHNTFLNHKSHRHPASNFNVALSDTTELGSIFIEKYEAGGHLKILDAPIKRKSVEFQPDFRQAVLKYRMDDFMALTKIPPPEYIKIDVDGYEQQVLRGMIQTLSSQTVKKILIELEEDGENFTACRDILQTLGFKIESQKRVQNYFGENNFIFSKKS